MSKELYLIGNLKMNMTKETITAHLKQIKKLAKGVDNHVGICVPYVYLLGVNEGIFPRSADENCIFSDNEKNILYERNKTYTYNV